MVIKNQKFSIYFGDAEQSISLDEIDAQSNTQALQEIAQQVQAQQIVFLKQEHGVQGKIIDFKDHQNYFFNQTGDYLISQKKDCGIGVVTADCLPIVIYDSETQTAAIIHAGWKGLAANIFEIAVRNVITATGARVENLEIYLGPAARPCCYEVQQDFVERFCETFSAIMQQVEREIFIVKDGKTYFDSRSFVAVIARNLGIAHEKLYTRYNVCTMCNLSFCSYRREQTKARRQVSMICLH